MKRFLITLTAILSVFTFTFANDVHELDNRRASVPANGYKNSRFLETKTVNGKEYITGKSSSYNKNGKANGGKILWPYAEYAIESNLMGGDYTITVHYRIDKNTAPDNASILLGMDLLESEELEINRKLINTVKATFNTKLLKGKKHTIKIWLPYEGVQIEKFEVKRAIITKKRN